MFLFEISIDFLTSSKLYLSSLIALSVFFSPSSLYGDEWFDFTFYYLGLCDFLLSFVCCFFNETIYSTQSGTSLLISNKESFFRLKACFLELMFLIILPNYFDGWSEDLLCLTYTD